MEVKTQSSVMLKTKGVGLSKENTCKKVSVIYIPLMRRE